MILLVIFYEPVNRCFDEFPGLNTEFQANFGKDIFVMVGDRTDKMHRYFFMTCITANLVFVKCSESFSNEVVNIRMIKVIVDKSAE